MHIHLVCKRRRHKMVIVFLVILLVSLGRTEREYFLQPNASSWEAARQHCRVCYKELATVTADNALHLLEKLDNSSLAVWVGLRRMLNETIASLSNATNNTVSTQHLESQWFSGTPPWVQVSNSTNETFDGNSTWFSFFEGKLPWSRWSNGDPVTFQNWYPGRPVLKPKPEPIKCEPNTGTNINPTTPWTPTTPQPHSTTDSSFTVVGNSTVDGSNTTYGNSTVDRNSTLDGNYTTYGNSTVDRNSTVDGNYTTYGNSTADLNSTIYGNSTTGMSNETTINGTTEQMNEARMCPRLEKLLKCIDDPEARDALFRSLTTPSSYQTSLNSTISPNTTIYDINNTITTPSPNATNFFNFTISPNTTMSDINTNSTPTLNVPNLNFTIFPNATMLDINTTNTAPTPNMTNLNSTISNETMFGFNTSSTVTISTSTSAPSTISTSISAPSTISTSTSAPSTISTSTSAPSTISTSTSAPSTISTTDTPPSTIPPPTATPCPIITDSREEDFNKFIEDACLVLLSFGLWWERACSEVLPYICYDDRFNGEVKVTNITYITATVDWLEAPGEISGYRVEVESEEHNWTQTLTTNLTTELQNLTSGTEYTIYVYPIKCGRDLNPQTGYFFTQPDQIRNLSLSVIRETSVTLIWSQPKGGSDFYRLCVYNSSHRVNCENVTKSQHTVTDPGAGGEYTVNNLTAGGKYTVEVSAEVADMSIPGRRFNQTFFTKPNKVKELAYRQPSISSFKVDWKAPEGFASTYRVLVKNESVLYNESLDVTSFTAHNLVPGSEFDVTVWARVNGSLEGEPETIQGFTKPSHVRDLTLNSTADTIGVSWTNPVGKYQNFSVKLYNPEKEVKSKIINDSQQLFQGLKAGANYTVEVQVCGFGKLKSIFKYKSIFTLPNKPKNLEVENEGKTEISLKWKVPDASEGVTILYDVFYISTFWKESNTTRVSTPSVTLKYLRPGTTYTFYVSVFAGDQNSENVTAIGKTEPNKRNISLSVLCASMEPISCQRETTQSNLLQALEEYFRETLDGVFVELKWSKNN